MVAIAETPTHPVRAGRPLVLRAIWEGAEPAVGEYLFARGANAKYGYRILEVRQIRGAGSGRAKSSAADTVEFDLMVEKIPRRTIPDDAVTYDWRWDRGDPKRETGFAWGRV